MNWQIKYEISSKTIVECGMHFTLFKEIGVRPSFLMKGYSLSVSVTEAVLVPGCITITLVHKAKCTEYDGYICDCEYKMYSFIRKWVRKNK